MADQTRPDDIVAPTDHDHRAPRELDDGAGHVAIGEEIDASGDPYEEGADGGYERGHGGGHAEEDRLGYPGDREADGGEHALGEAGEHGAVQGHAPHAAELAEELSRVLGTERGHPSQGRHHARPVTQ